MKSAVTRRERLRATFESVAVVVVGMVIGTGFAFIIMSRFAVQPDPQRSNGRRIAAGWLAGSLFTTNNDNQGMRDRQFWESVIEESAPQALKSNCKELFHGAGSSAMTFGQAPNMGLVTFHSFFASMRGSNHAYLDITDSDEHSLQSILLDVCLGWKGVRLKFDSSAATESSASSKPKVPSLEWEKYRKVRVIEACPSPSKCVSLKEILQENQDILGPADAQGRFGSSLRFMTIALSDTDRVVSLLACSDLRQMLSSSHAFVQSLSIWTVKMNGNQLRLVDVALMRAGFIKVSPVLSLQRTFQNDLFLRNHGMLSALPEALPAQMKCPRNQTTCPLADILSSVDGEGVSCSGGY